MNQTQKNFRKQMKQLEKEGYVESGTASSYRPKNRKSWGFAPFLFAVILLLLFNPELLGIDTDGDENINAGYSFYVDPKEEIVAKYVEQTDNVDVLQKDTMEMIKSVIEKRESYKVELIQEKLTRIIQLKDELRTDNELISEVESNALEELELLEDLVVYSLTNYKMNTSQEWVDKYNNTRTEMIELQIERVEIITTLFREVGIEYEIRDDGSIYYEYEYRK